MTVIKWPKVYDARNMAARLSEERLQSLVQTPYRAKVKIHGTNCAVQIHPDGRVVSQSRNRVLTPEGRDHHGFADWVRSRSDEFAQSAGEIPGETIVVYGELFGPGIHGPETAANQVSKKYWGIFAVCGDGRYVAPDDIATILSPRLLAPRSHEEIQTFVIPWHGNDLHPFLDKTGALDPEVGSAVQAVGAEDPLVRAIAGVSGPGEGLVYFPLRSGGGDMFKAKAPSFMNRKPLPSGSNGRVRRFLIRERVRPVALAVATPDRIQQGYEEVRKDRTGLPVMGDLLVWLARDITEECQAELDDAGLGYSEIRSAVASVAREWVEAYG